MKRSINGALSVMSYAGFLVLQIGYVALISFSGCAHRYHSLIGSYKTSAEYANPSCGVSVADGEPRPKACN